MMSAVRLLGSLARIVETICKAICGEPPRIAAFATSTPGAPVRNAVAPLSAQPASESSNSPKAMLRTNRSVTECRHDLDHGRSAANHKDARQNTSDRGQGH